MNKKLFEKVKSLCKDNGLSEKYLSAITEKLGGNVKDDSTDETEIETAANLIADVAKESQGEAARWVQKNKDKDPKDPKEPKDPKDPKDNGNDPKEPTEFEKRLKAMEDVIAGYKAKEAKEKRMSEINAALDKHKIPSYLRNRLASSIGDDEDIEDVVASLKQDLITNGLVTDSNKGSKAASEKQVDEAADSLLNSITVK